MTENRNIGVVKEPLSVCFICDDAYAMYTAVAITSLIENKAPAAQYRVYIIANGLSDETIGIFRGMSCGGCSVEVIETENPQQYEHLAKEGFPVSTSALFKFDLPRIFHDVSKLLYLDGDMIIQRDLTELFDTDVSDVYAAVVKDYRALTLKGNLQERLNTDLESYFNSGMMLLNLDLMRRDNIPEKLLDYRINGINYYMDQDALNIVFGRQVRYVSFNYNFQATCWRFMDTSELVSYYYLPYVRDKYDYVKDAVIFHYTAEKPWAYYDGKCSEIWLHYFLRSPYQHVKLERQSILALCKTEADRRRIYQNRETFPQDYTFALSRTPLISVIMPVYNAEKYIRHAIVSLKKQTLTDFEVICVNDCSTDDTRRTLEAFAKNDARFRIVHAEQNGRAGKARNIALSHARGEYVTFLDADDELPVHALERYYITAKATDADFIFAQTEINQKPLSSSVKAEYLPENEVFSPEDVQDYLLSITHGGPSGKCLKRSFVEEHGLAFLEIARSEDFYLFHRALMLAKKITAIRESLYIVHESANPFSLEHTKDQTPMIFWEASCTLRGWMQENGYYEKYKRSFINSCVSRTFFNLRAMKSGEGVCCVQRAIADTISRELEFGEHDDAYFYEKDCYKKLCVIAEQTENDYIYDLYRKSASEAAMLRRRLNEAEKKGAPSAELVKEVDRLKRKIKFIEGTRTYKLALVFKKLYQPIKRIVEKKK